MTNSLPEPLSARTRDDHEHVVRLYEHDDFLVDTVAGFIAAAMLRREAGIILATPTHQAAIESRLRAAGLDLDLLQRTEQLVVRDAQALLAELIVDGLPDPSRFRSTVGALVAKATRAETRRVRVFGEMVDVLAADGNMTAALRLEELWADLQLSQPFALFCAYPLHRFSGTSGGAALEGVCERHGRVIPTEGYSTLEVPDEQLRTIAMLQQQALALTAEVHARQRSDDRLRRQFLANPLPTFVWERTPGVGPDGADDYLLVEQNEAAERFLGVSGADAVGSRLSSIDPGSPMGALPDLLACADPDRRVWREHSFTARETGQRRYIQMSLVAMPPDLAIVFVEDVTERLEADERKVQEARSEKLRALGQLASGVAHDLNQHLTMIAGSGELIRDALQREQVSPEVQAALDAILRAALDGGETVSQLLRFGRHQPDGAHAPVDVTGLLQEVARLTAPRWRDLAQLEGRPIRLEVLVTGDDLEVLGHAPSLCEALTNLIFNAVDALPYGGEIHLAAERAGEQVVISATDTGTGMSPEVRARVFEPFFSAGGSTRGERGSGLAMAHVWSTVERHGGTLDVQTSEQAGDTRTTIRLTLPVAPPTQTVAPRQILTGTGPRLRLLVVDDEPALAQLAAQGLRRAGHQVVARHSATEALETLEPEAFDVLVTDLGLGEGMNGWELVAQARKVRTGLRVVMVSGWASDIEPALAAANGVDAVVAKPYRLAELIQAVEGQSSGIVDDSEYGDHAQDASPPLSGLPRGAVVSTVQSAGWAPRRSIGA